MAVAATAATSEKADKRIIKKKSTKKNAEAKSRRVQNTLMLLMTTRLNTDRDAERCADS